LKIQSQKEIIEFKLIKTAGYVVHAKVNRTAVIPIVNLGLASGSHAGNKLFHNSIDHRGTKCDRQWRRMIMLKIGRNDHETQTHRS
jgi:hypothetical protein